MDTRCAYGFSAGRWEDLSLISLSRLFLSSFHFSNLLHAAISFGLRRMVARSLSLALLYILVSIDQYSVYTKSWILPDYLAVSCLIQFFILDVPTTDSQLYEIDRFRICRNAGKQGIGCCTTRRIFVTAASHEQGSVEEYGRYGHLYGWGHVSDHVTAP